MYNLWGKKSFNKLEVSSLFDETSFYQQFITDLGKCMKEVIIESPYITSTRMKILVPELYKLVKNGKKVTIVTRDPVEHDEIIKYQATEEILKCVELGINVQLITGYLHRKLAIIDKEILWEGSLNILSQSNSKEIMRRIESRESVKQMFEFLEYK